MKLKPRAWPTFSPGMLFGYRKDIQLNLTPDEEQETFLLLNPAPTVGKTYWYVLCLETTTAYTEEWMLRWLVRIA